VKDIYYCGKRRLVCKQLALGFLRPPLFPATLVSPSLLPDLGTKDKILKESKVAKTKTKLRL